MISIIMVTFYIRLLCSGVSTLCDMSNYFCEIKPQMFLHCKALSFIKSYNLLTFIQRLNNITFLMWILSIHQLQG